MADKQMDYFPVWSRYYPMFQKAALTPHQLGELMYAMMAYQFEDLEPVDLEPLLQVFWGFIKEDLNRVQLRYQTAVENGKKGGRPKKKTQRNPKKPITKTESKTKTESRTETETETPDAAEGESVCQNPYGEYGWILLTQEQFGELEALMGNEELQRCIAYIDRAAQTTGNRNHWQDWELVLRRCFENRWHEADCRADAVPKGASGLLGEAELEAIARVLNE